MPLGQDEAVPILPMRIIRVNLHDMEIQGGDYLYRGESSTRMSHCGMVDHVDDVLSDRPGNLLEPRYIRFIVRNHFVRCLQSMSLSRTKFMMYPLRQKAFEQTLDLVVGKGNGIRLHGGVVHRISCYGVQFFLKDLFVDSKVSDGPREV